MSSYVKGVISSCLVIKLQNFEDGQDEIACSDEQKDWANQLILRLTRNAFEETTDDETENEDYAIHGKEDDEKTNETRIRQRRC